MSKEEDAVLRQGLDKAAASALRCFKASGNCLDGWAALAFIDKSRPLPPELAEVVQAAAIALHRLAGSDLDAAEAARRVPAALGLVAQGYNAFSEVEKDNAAAWVALR